MVIKAAGSVTAILKGVVPDTTVNGRWAMSSYRGHWLINEVGPWTLASEIGKTIFRLASRELCPNLKDHPEAKLLPNRVLAQSPSYKFRLSTMHWH